MTSPSFRITVDASAAEDVSAWFKHLRKDQLPFATSKAINLTLKDVRRGQVGAAFKKFKLRRKTLPRVAIQTQFSSKKQWPNVHGMVYVPEKYSFLALQETGGTKRGKGGHRVAVPTRIVKMKAGGGPQRRDRPRSVRARKGAYVGGPRDNQIIHKASKGSELRRRLGIFYTLHESVKIKPAFRFEQTGRNVIKRVWFGHFRREYNDSIKPPRPRAKRPRGLPG